MASILNPKVAVFYLAFMPHLFLHQARKPLSFIILAIVCMTAGRFWCLVFALFTLRGLKLATAKFNS